MFGSRGQGWDEAETRGEKYMGQVSRDELTKDVMRLAQGLSVVQENQQ